MKAYLNIARDLQSLSDSLPTIHQGSKYLPTKGGGSSPSKNKRNQLRKKRK